MLRQKLPRSHEQTSVDGTGAATIVVIVAPYSSTHHKHFVTAQVMFRYGTIVPAISLRNKYSLRCSPEDAY